MKFLIAKFQVELDNPILVQTRQNQFLKFEFTLDEADVQLRLITDQTFKKKQKGKHAWSFTVYFLEILVALPENEEPPLADITPKDGHSSYYEIEQYFEKRMAKFRIIAEKVYQRLIKYFKYNNRIPYLSDEIHRSKFALPIWIDDKGTEIWKTRSRTFYVPYIPGFGRSEFGIKEFRHTDSKKLVTTLINDMDFTLYQEILSDAQTAILEGNYRRGILEMAIACEIAVKQVFFAKSTTAGIAYEYLENQGGIHVRAIDLISKVSEYTFGENFRSVNKKAYMNIDYMFRCRNSIAHRGEVNYRDDKGILRSPDNNTLKDWWTSLEEMLAWLYKKKEVPCIVLKLYIAKT